jgi:hypothetical protein
VSPRLTRGQIRQQRRARHHADRAIAAATDPAAALAVAYDAYRAVVRRLPPAERAAERQHMARVLDERARDLSTR